MSSRSLFSLLLALSLVLSAFGADGALAQDKSKKKSKKKDAPKEQKAELPVESAKEIGDSPFDDLRLLMDQAPRFKRFSRQVFQATMSLVVFQDKEMLFLDGCQATRTKTTWKVSQCRVARAGEKEFLAKLVKLGAKLSAEPENAAKLNELFDQVRKVKKPEDLDGLMAAAVDKSPKGYKPTKEMLKEFEVCGAKRYADALESLPSLVFLGDRAVMVEISYSLYSSRPVVVRLTAGKTNKGWKLSKLLVACQP